MAFPKGDPVLGLAEWQSAFIAVGILGLLLAVWVVSSLEPIRGAIDWLETSKDLHPFKGFVREL